jgi:hypothetical protein
MTSSLISRVPMASFFAAELGLFLSAEIDDRGIRLVNEVKSE